MKYMGNPQPAKASIQRQWDDPHCVQLVLFRHLRRALSIEGTDFVSNQRRTIKDDACIHGSIYLELYHTINGNKETRQRFR